MTAFILPLGVIGVPQLILVVAIAVLLFGGKKIPELMRGVGRGVKEFKDAVNKDYSAEDTKPSSNETVKDNDTIL